MPSPLVRRLAARILAACGIAVASVACGCGTVPETGRSQFNLLSTSDEVALGEQAYAEIRKLWKELRDSRDTLLSPPPG